MRAMTRFLGTAKPLIGVSLDSGKVPTSSLYGLLKETACIATSCRFVARPFRLPWSDAREEHVGRRSLI